ncbi:hypothetical protein CN380_22970 [Bacillus sp. AFS017274]|nr:hypothetical protein CN380_22970 [Bacillus sp. AFS017274]
MKRISAITTSATVINEMINKRLAISILLLQVITIEVNLLKPEFLYIELQMFEMVLTIRKYIISSRQSQHIGKEIEMVEEGII